MARRNLSAGDALVDFGLRLGACAGLGLGLLLALDTPPSTPASCSERADPSNPLAGCINDGVIAAVAPYAVWMGLGLILGGATGWLAFRFIVRAGALAISGPERSRPPQPKAPPLTTSPARTMIARFDSPCSSCGTDIVPGSLMQWRGPKQSVCASCAWPS